MPQSQLKARPLLQLHIKLHHKAPLLQGVPYHVLCTTSCKKSYINHRHLSCISKYTEKKPAQHALGWPLRLFIHHSDSPRCVLMPGCHPWNTARTQQPHSHTLNRNLCSFVLELSLKSVAITRCSEKFTLKVCLLNMAETAKKKISRPCVAN